VTHYFHTITELGAAHTEGLNLKWNDIKNTDPIPAGASTHGRGRGAGYWFSGCVRLKWTALPSTSPYIVNIIRAILGKEHAS